MKNILGLLLIALVAFSSCKKKLSAEEQAAADDQIIQDYIAQHNLSAEKKASGLYVVIDNPGNGTQPDSFSDVRVQYKGYLTDGDVFDESTIQGIEFNLQNVIKGWTEGITYYKEGGSGVLLIPSALGYGSQGSGSIPPNSVIIFDVTLIDVL